jgi:hypothetical protein
MLVFANRAGTPIRGRRRAPRAGGFNASALTAAFGRSATLPRRCGD